MRCLLLGLAAGAVCCCKNEPCSATPKDGVVWNPTSGQCCRYRQATQCDKWSGYRTTIPAEEAEQKCGTGYNAAMQRIQDLPTWTPAAVGGPGDEDLRHHVVGRYCKQPGALAGGFDGQQPALKSARAEDFAHERLVHQLVHAMRHAAGPEEISVQVCLRWAPDFEFRHLAADEAGGHEDWQSAATMQRYLERSFVPLRCSERLGTEGGFETFEDRVLAAAQFLEQEDQHYADLRLQKLEAEQHRSAASLTSGNPNSALQQIKDDADFFHPLRVADVVRDRKCTPSPQAAAELAKLTGTGAKALTEKTHCPLLLWWQAYLKAYDAKFPRRYFLAQPPVASRERPRGARVTVCFGHQAGQIHRRPNGQHLLMAGQHDQCLGLQDFAAGAAALKRVVALWRPPTCHTAQTVATENERLLAAAEAASRVLRQPVEDWVDLVGAEGQGQPALRTAALHPAQDQVQLKWALCPLTDQQVLREQLDRDMSMDTLPSLSVSTSGTLDEPRALPYGGPQTWTGEQCAPMPQPQPETLARLSQCDFGTLREDTYKGERFACPDAPRLEPWHQVSVLAAKREVCYAFRPQAALTPFDTPFSVGVVAPSPQDRLTRVLSQTGDERLNIARRCSLEEELKYPKWCGGLEVWTVLTGGTPQAKKLHAAPASDQVTWTPQLRGERSVAAALAPRAPSASASYTSVHSGDSYPTPTLASVDVVDSGLPSAGPSLGKTSVDPVPSVVKVGGSGHTPRERPASSLESVEELPVSVVLPTSPRARSTRVGSGQGSGRGVMPTTVAKDEASRSEANPSVRATNGLLPARERISHMPAPVVVGRLGPERGLSADEARDRAMPHEAQNLRHLAAIRAAAQQHRPGMMPRGSTVGLKTPAGDGRSQPDVPSPLGDTVVPPRGPLAEATVSTGGKLEPPPINQGSLVVPPPKAGSSGAKLEPPVISRPPPLPEHLRAMQLAPVETVPSGGKLEPPAIKKGVGAPPPPPPPPPPMDSSKLTRAAPTSAGTARVLQSAKMNPGDLQSQLNAFSFKKKEETATGAATVSTDARGIVNREPRAPKPDLAGALGGLQAAVKAREQRMTTVDVDEQVARSKADPPDPRGALNAAILASSLRRGQKETVVTDIDAQLKRQRAEKLTAANPFLAAIQARKGDGFERTLSIDEQIKRNKEAQKEKPRMLPGEGGEPSRPAQLQPTMPGLKPSPTGAKPTLQEQLFAALLAKRPAIAGTTTTNGATTTRWSSSSVLETGSVAAGPGAAPVSLVEASSALPLDAGALGDRLKAETARQHSGGDLALTRDWYDYLVDTSFAAVTPEELIRGLSYQREEEAGSLVQYAAAAPCVFEPEAQLQVLFQWGEVVLELAREALAQRLLGTPSPVLVVQGDRHLAVARKPGVRWYTVPAKEVPAPAVMKELAFGKKTWALRKALENDDQSSTGGGTSGIQIEFHCGTRDEVYARAYTAPHGGSRTTTPFDTCVKEDKVVLARLSPWAGAEHPFTIEGMAKDVVIPTAFFARLLPRK